MDGLVARDVTVRNRRGLHARAAAKITTLAESFDAHVHVLRDDQSVSALSIMGLMLLGAGPGTRLRLSASGREAAAALHAIGALIESGFDEAE